MNKTPEGGYIGVIETRYASAQNVFISTCRRFPEIKGVNEIDRLSIEACVEEWIKHHILLGKITEDDGDDVRREYNMVE
jgi:hypothetical protein